MLEIKIYHNNVLKNIDLPEKLKLSFNLNSPIWDFDKIAGSYTLPFELPNTPNNRKLLNIPCLESIDNSIDYECAIYINGLLFKEGVLTITECDNHILKASILLNISRINKIADKLIRELDIFGSEQNWEWKSEYLPEQDNFALPEILDDIFLKDTFWEDRSKPINWYDTDNNKYYGQYAAQNGYASDYHPVVPQPQLNFIIKKLFQYFGYTIDYNYFNENENQKIIILSVDDAMFVKYDNDNDGFFCELNTYNLKNHLPYITVAEFLNALHNFFALDFNIIGNDISIKPIKEYLEDNSYIDITDKVSREIRVINKEPITGIILNWQEHPDEYTSGAKFKDSIEWKPLYTNTDPNYPQPDIVMNNTGLIMIPSGNVTYKPEFYIAEYFEWQTGEIEFRWHYFYDKNNMDAFFGDIYQDFFSKKFTKKPLSINLNIAPFATKTYSWAVDYNHSKIRQKGNTYLNSDKRQKYGLRLAYYKGKNRNNIPYIGHWSAGNTNSKQLDLWSTDGIWDTYWKKVFQYLASVDREYQMQVIFSIRDILFFDFSRKYKINNQLFFIKNVKFSIDINGNISICNVTLMPTFQ